MAVISDYKTWQLNDREARMAKGRLVRVRHPDGHYSKMYEADAIAAGLLPGAKMRAAASNKMAPAPADKAEAKPAEPDDFTTIAGVGKAATRALWAQGINTFDDLRTADLSQLDLTKRTQTAIEEWRDAA